MAKGNGFKTWIEIDRSAVQHNVRAFRKLLAPKTQLWAVVKSNAYGHGLILFSKLLNKLNVDGFCVDSVVEGLKLRQNRIKKPILVLGPTLNQGWLKTAKEANITLTVSSREALQEISKAKHRPKFHLKIDTGMHRQGFQLNDLKKIVQQIRNLKFEIRNRLTGIYTHFAMPQNRAFTEKQFREFQDVLVILKNYGFKNVIRHTAATGGAIADPKYHLDAVRIGAGLYGFLPSRDFQLPVSSFQPVLAWHALVSEVKLVPKGEYIGYDCTERLARDTNVAVIPIGYWHGYDRSLSSVGEVLIHGKRTRVLGRVCMDLIAVDATGIMCKPGDRATLIGMQGRNEITANELGAFARTSHYEMLTRLNPLMERMVRN